MLKSNAVKQALSNEAADAVIAFLASGNKVSAVKPAFKKVKTFRNDDGKPPKYINMKGQ